MQGVQWKIREVAVCESTLNEARHLPPWSIVSAVLQTKGRGRFNHAWQAGEGGLWASYNLPLEAPQPRSWGYLPLVAGVAVIAALRKFRLQGLRLRWPNDVLVGRGKLCGILVERPVAGMASVGIGLNVYNDVEAIRDSCSDPPVRLADLVRACPSVGELRMTVADSLAEVFARFCEGGAEAVAPELTAAWGRSLPVVAVTDTKRYCGFFVGAAHDGAPILQRADGLRFTIPGVAVMRLKELV